MSETVQKRIQSVNREERRIAPPTVIVELIRGQNGDHSRANDVPLHWPFVIIVQKLELK